MQISWRQVGEFLVNGGVLSREQMDAALLRQETSGVSFEKIVLTDGLVSEHDLTSVIAKTLGLMYWEFTDAPLPPDVSRIPESVARRLNAVAVRVDGGHLVVAMADPTDPAATDELAEITGETIRPALATSSALTRMMALVYAKDGHVGAAVTAPVDANRPLDLNQLLAQIVTYGASDLHLTVGIPPSVRIDGVIYPLDDHPPLQRDTLRSSVYSILTERQRERFETNLELDTSYSTVEAGRFRVNIFQQMGSLGAVMRVIPADVVPLAQLGLPQALTAFTELPRGLVLVTGPTGSGKSTTLASMVDVINSTRPLHIMTVEDPIEFLHHHKRSIVNQREVGEDTRSFAAALKHVLRQDPDVILVGEMRDLETISTAITAAETGHLVFGTLHTIDAPQSIDRIIDVFPPHQQQQVRVQLAASLRGIVTQQLLPRREGRGRLAVCEILVATPAVRNLIREGKTHQIYSAMQAGGQFGMQTMDQSLAAAVRSGTIELDIAVERCASEDDLRRMVTGR
jgi:twitching motility protein PilT